MNVFNPSRFPHSVQNKREAACSKWFSSSAEEKIIMFGGISVPIFIELERFHGLDSYPYNMQLSSLAFLDPDTRVFWVLEVQITQA